MGLRTILIAAGLAMAGTFCLAQRATTVTPAPAPPAINAPGATNVPIGPANAVGVGAGTTAGAIPTAIVVPTNTTGFVGPSQSYPLVSTPSVTFVTSPDGTTTIPVVRYAGGAASTGSNPATELTASLASASRLAKTRLPCPRMIRMPCRHLTRAPNRTRALRRKSSSLRRIKSQARSRLKSNGRFCTSRDVLAASLSVLCPPA